MLPSNLGIGLPKAEEGGRMIRVHGYGYVRDASATKAISGSGEEFPLYKDPEGKKPSSRKISAATIRVVLSECAGKGGPSIAG